VKGVETELCKRSTDQGQIVCIYENVTLKPPVHAIYPDKNILMALKIQLSVS
jgi:hypothetical protein